MAHPMMGMLRGYRGQPQMGGIFDDLLSNINNALSTGVDKAKNDAIANALKTLVKDPVIQNAVVESGNDAAITNLAAQLKAAQTSTLNYVKTNPYSTMLIVGGVGVGVLLLIMSMRSGGRRAHA